ncbi:MAG: 2-amino-4-hydroxy-6-hydroxymethyldihydropteridine diphosphokinase [Candidatus Omnitrophica bacterium]|nr:2-amino-4-hydroxy-6-hydroxymethyldihydropteridine diphosphokinase [Candidatus Omnitrophota bacterium]
MPTVYLAYGSNMGHRRQNINDAVKLLNKNGIKVTTVSKPIETKPIGGVPQANFLNGVMAAETKLAPEQLLSQIKMVEQKIGRVKNLKNGPRPIDIDILLYGNLKIKTDKLQIPHPEITQRSFVRNPLKEIAPHLRLP